MAVGDQSSQSGLEIHALNSSLYVNTRAQIVDIILRVLYKTRWIYETTPWPKTTTCENDVLSPNG